MLLLALAAAGLLALARAEVVRSRAGLAADAAALAAARSLSERYADLFPRWDPAARRSLPPRLTRAAYEALARVAAARAAARAGARLAAVAFDANSSGGPSAAGVRVVLVRDTLPGWVGAARRTRARTAEARAGLALAPREADPSLARPADLSGFEGAGAVVAAAQAQLGWPYVWGGESREEGGFDCSGLVAYAFNAAGYQVGRPVAAGFQQMSAPVPLRGDALRPGDLLFVGAPAHHVGLVAAPGIAIEAPHRGARVHYERIADGGWTSAGRLPALGGGATSSPGAGGDVPSWVPPDWRALIGEAARRESLPPALLAAQIEAESGFDARAVSRAGARGAAQFMPATWAAAWNPYRARSPFEPRYALLRRRALPAAPARPGAAATSHARWPPTTRAWRAARAPGRPRRAPTSRASCGASAAPRRSCPGPEAWILLEFGCFPAGSMTRAGEISGCRPKRGYRSFFAQGRPDAAD